MRPRWLQNVLTPGVLLCAGVWPAAAQTNEVGLQIGAAVTPAPPVRFLTNAVAGGAYLTFRPSLALGADYDRQIRSTPRLKLYAGADLLASPFDVKLNAAPASVSPQYAYIFLTAHVKAKLNLNGPVQPWLSFGGGYTRFREASPAVSSAPPFRSGNNTGAIEFGGGIDSKPLVRLAHIPVGARVEVRDFYSGLPNYGIPTTAGLQNTVVLTGGFLLKF